MEDNFENKQENQEQGASQPYTYSNSGQEYGNSNNNARQYQYQDNYNYNVGNNTGYHGEYYDGMDNAPLSMGEWVLTLLLMSIPCVNIIMCCVWAFGKTGNINRRNFCRAELIFIGIGIVLSIIVFVIMFVTGVGIMEGMTRGGGYYYY